MDPNRGRKRNNVSVRPKKKYKGYLEPQNSSDEEPTIPRRTLNRYKKGSKTLKKGQLENNWSRDFNCSTSSEDGRPNDDVHSSYGEMVRKLNQ